MRALKRFVETIGLVLAGGWLLGCAGDVEQREDVARDARVHTASVQQATTLAGSVIPRFECVASANGRTTAVFGYTNTGSSTIAIPAGARNHFVNATSLGQPEAFLPGSHSFAFGIDLQTLAQTWSLDGLIAVALIGGPRCPTHLDAFPEQDTGVASATPDENNGTDRTELVDTSHSMLVQFDRADLNARIGTARYVTKAQLVLKATKGFFSNAPKLQSLALKRLWTERGATWNCADDQVPSNSVTDCSPINQWNLVRRDVTGQNPWFTPDPAAPSLATWNFDRVTFDVTKDVVEFLGGARQRRDLGWIVVGTNPADPTVALDTRESLFTPELEVDVTVPTGTPPTPPLSFTVSSQIQPSPTTFLSDGTTTPHAVAALVDPHGLQSNFVVDELVISTNDPAAVARVASDWNGQVLHASPPPDGSIPGAEQTYLVQIDLTRATPAALVPNLQSIDNRPRGVHQVSSADVLALLTAASTEYLKGTHVGINTINTTAADAISFDSIASKDVEEGPDNSGLGQGTNSLEWDPFTRQPLATFHMGVADAWRALFFENKLKPGQVKVNMIDRGFALPYVQSDLLSQTLLFGSGSPNTDGGGAWHGTWTTEAGFGAPGNSFGAAGPGGPVSRVTLNYSSQDLIGLMESMALAAATKPRIINASLGDQLPAVATFLLEPQQAITAALRSSGTLFFASAGNNGANVDDEDCFIVCWEGNWYYPCENDGVTCVGGINFFSDSRAGQSNFGAKDVDIFGPFTGLVGGPNTVSDGVNFTGARFMSKVGTSFSSPFVAGVAALEMAAAPKASADQIIGWMMDRANGSSDGTVNRVVEAFNAVSAALGDPTGFPPRIQILTPQDGDDVAPGFNTFQAKVATFDDSTPAVGWFSNIDGTIGTGITSNVDLFTLGPQVITAAASNSSGSNSDSVSINVTQPPPNVVIDNPPSDGSVFPSNTPVTFHASVTNRIGFDCNNMVWSGDIVGLNVIGCSVSLVPSKTQSVIRATATDGALSGHAERLVLTGGAASMSVVITNPVVGSQNFAAIPRTAPVQLTATVTDPSGVSFGVGWFFSDGHDVQILGAGESFSWLPSDNVPPKCGGDFGQLSVIVEDANGNIVGTQIDLQILDSPC